MMANIHHFAYSQSKFSDIINQAGLTADFNYALSYLNQVKTQLYPAQSINIPQFSIEKDFKLTLSDPLNERINEH